MVPTSLNPTASVHAMTWSDPELLEYLFFRLSAHLNYRCAIALSRDPNKLIAQARESVQRLPTSALYASNDVRSLLELGIRYAFP